jgi:hypothetical protein
MFVQVTQEEFTDLGLNLTLTWEFNFQRPMWASEDSRFCIAWPSVLNRSFARLLWDLACHTKQHYPEVVTPGFNREIRYHDLGKSSQC